jgi:hypothetical protein
MPRRVSPCLCDGRISDKAPYSAGSGSIWRPSPDSRNPNAMFPTRSPWIRLWRRVSCTLPYGFPFPLGDRSHDRNHQPARGGARVQRFGDRDQRDPSFLEQLQQPTQVFDAACERSRLATITACTLPAMIRASTRCRPGRFSDLADSPASTITSSSSPPWTVAIARIFPSSASSETPCSACPSVETRHIQ